MSNLKNFNSWEKQQLVTLRKGEEVVYLVLEYNQFYGDLITRFQIGPNPHRTTVLIGTKYCGSKQDFLACAEQNGLIGERPFENGSVTWEFLWKPLGLEHPANKSACCSYPTYTSFPDFMEVAEKVGWKRVGYGE